MKPGMFSNWKECIIKLSVMVLWVVCVGSMVLWAMGKLSLTGR
jgi:hypothetical protein